MTDNPIDVAVDTRDWPTEIEDWAETELPATEAFLREVAQAFVALINSRAEMRNAARPVVERYGRVWAKDTDYYAAAEVLGIQEPPA